MYVFVSLPQTTFRSRAEFSSCDEYAVYVRDNLRAGMCVRCCKSYEEVHAGDVGTVVRVDKGALHNLNVQVGPRIPSTLTIVLQL